MIIVRTSPEGYDISHFGHDPILGQQAGLVPLFVVNRGKTIGLIQLQFQSELVAQIHVDFIVGTKGSYLKKAFQRFEVYAKKLGICKVIAFIPKELLPSKGFSYIVGGHIVAEIPDFFKKDGETQPALLAYKDIV